MGEQKKTLKEKISRIITGKEKINGILDYIEFGECITSSDKGDPMTVVVIRNELGDRYGGAIDSHLSELNVRDKIEATLFMRRPVWIMSKGMYAEGVLEWGHLPKRTYFPFVASYRVLEKRSVIIP